VQFAKKWLVYYLRKLMGNRYAFIHLPKELGGVLTEVLDGKFDKKKKPE